MPPQVSAPMFPYLGKPVNVIVQEKPCGTHYRLKAYPVDCSQQFHFLSDLTVRGKRVLRDLGVEFAVAPVVSDNNGVRMEP